MYAVSRVFVLMKKVLSDARKEAKIWYLAKEDTNLLTGWAWLHLIRKRLLTGTGALDDQLSFDIQCSQTFFGCCERVERSAASNTNELYKEMMENYKYFILVVCQNTF